MLEGARAKLVFLRSAQKAKRGGSPLRILNKGG